MLNGPREGGGMFILVTARRGEIGNNGSEIESGWMKMAKGESLALFGLRSMEIYSQKQKIMK